MSRLNRSADSFTLVELLVGLVLFTFLITLSCSYFSHSDSAILGHELEKLAITFGYLKNKAIATHTNQELLFDLEENSYAYNNEKNRLSAPIQFGFLPSSFGPPSAPHRRITRSITFQDQKVCFFADGTISPGTLYLCDRKKRWMKALTCSISAVSYIRKYQYINAKWKPLHVP